MPQKKKLLKRHCHRRQTNKKNLLGFFKNTSTARNNIFIASVFLLAVLTVFAHAQNKNSTIPIKNTENTVVKNPPASNTKNKKNLITNRSQQPIADETDYKLLNSPKDALQTIKTNTNKTNISLLGSEAAFTYHFGPLAENLAQMQRDGVINSYKFTLLLFKLFSLEKNIKRGTYTFKRSDSLITIMRRLERGDEDTQLVTIVEGFDIYDIDARLLKLQLIKKRGDFIRLSKSHPRLQEINKLLNLSGKNKLPSLEGTLTPNSYRVRVSIAASEIINLSTKSFTTQIVPFLKKNVAEKDFKKIITIASLVEKETIVEKERALVSAVVYNRLQENMKLRYDPTIIYALKENGTYIQHLKNGNINIKKSHFTMKSPYNTYYIKGLPPGPITSPTLASVKAAASPAKVDYLFFVAKNSNHNAGHYFSTTYEQHLANIKKYRNAKN